MLEWIESHNPTLNPANFMKTQLREVVGMGDRIVGGVDVVVGVGVDRIS